MKRSRLIVPATALVWALASCSDASGPGDVDGAYVLESIDADVLPATLTYSPNTSIEVRADTIWLNDDGTGRQWRRQLSDFGDGFRDDQFETLITFRVKDGVIEITYVCPPNASCVEGPHAYAWRHSRGMLLREAFEGRSESVWLYRSN